MSKDTAAETPGLKDALLISIYSETVCKKFVACNLSKIHGRKTWSPSKLASKETLAKSRAKNSIKYNITQR